MNRKRVDITDALVESGSLLAGELDALWWAFDELMDVWLDHRADAYELARRAAAEWLALEEDAQIETYFDRWDLEIHLALRAWGPSPIAPHHAIPDRLDPPTSRIHAEGLPEPQ